MVVTQLIRMASTRAATEIHARLMSRGEYVTLAVPFHKLRRPPVVGATVGPYQVLARLGAGGMGEVYLGHDPRLQRRVALKCLTAADTQSDDARARVLREARAAARLTHPNIAGVYDVLEQDGR